MKIDKNIINILKNFSQNSLSLSVKKGNKIGVISESRNTIAESYLPVPFERDFAVYDLSKFISCLSMFSSPELTFQKTYVTIGDDNRSINYMYVDEDPMCICLYIGLVCMHAPFYRTIGKNNGPIDFDRIVL